MLAIAFDPGLAKTGYCIAKDGEVVRLGIIKTPSNVDLPERLKRLVYELIDVYIWAWRTFGGFLNSEESAQFKFDVCLLEDFTHRHGAHEKSAGNKMMPSMIKCATARGVIFATFFSDVNEIKFISKGTIKKEETRLLAINRGIIKSDAPKNIHDALDAYQLLVCAGICK